MKIKPLQAHKIEHSVEDKIRAAIENLGGYVIKNQAGATTGRGKPDLSACINGNYYGIEVKRDNNKIETTVPQFNNLMQIAKAGGFALYSKTDDMFDLTKYKTEEQALPSENIVSELLSYLRQKDVKMMQITPKHLILYRKK